MLDDVILQLDEGLEDFLLRWAEHLRQLGYFKLTFATRDESVDNYPDANEELTSNP